MRAVFSCQGILYIEKQGRAMRLAKDIHLSFFEPLALFPMQQGKNAHVICPGPYLT